MINSSLKPKPFNYDNKLIENDNWYTKYFCIFAPSNHHKPK